MKKKRVAWEKVCKPTEEAGLGRRDLGEVKKALNMKLAWNLLHGSTLWSKLSWQSMLNLLILIWFLILATVRGCVRPFYPF